MAVAGVKFGADVLVLDYLQQLTGAGGSDQRERLDGMMAQARRLCDKDALVLAAAAVARQKSDAGRSSYQGLGLASFRGSSELEFGADACFLLVPDGDADAVLLQCEKNRYGEPRDISLVFRRKYQRFDAQAGTAPGPVTVVRVEPTVLVLPAARPEANGEGDAGA